MSKKPFTGLIIPANPFAPMRKVIIGKDYQNIADALNVRMIDCTCPSESLDFFIDDEGRLIADPQFNVRAVLIYEREFMKGAGRPSFISLYGDVLLTGGADEDGYSLSITDEQISEIENYLLEC